MRNSKFPFVTLLTLIVTSSLIYTFVLRSVVRNDLHCLSAKVPAGLQSSLFNPKLFVSVPIELIASGMPIVLEQNDKTLIDFIWSKKFIKPPSTQSYNLKQSNEDPSRGQAQFIRKLLNNKTNGFFVECGALDGETRSNSLFLEMHLNWTGLLVEGDPKNFAILETKNRKAWAANTCLSVKPHPHTASFLQSFNTGQVLSDEEATKYTKENYVEVQCLPLFSLLAAINVTTVDYFSLDVEGSELKVLKTIPFDKVFIKTLSVEYIHTSEGKDELIDFMTSKGYLKVGEVHYPGGLANDVIFAHKDVDLP